MSAFAQMVVGFGGAILHVWLTVLIIVASASAAFLLILVALIFLLAGQVGREHEAAARAIRIDEPSGAGDGR